MASSNDRVFELHPESGLRRRMMGGTLALAIALLVVKVVAWRLTGSQALFSDALESVVNVITGAFGLFSVWLATRPPDATHPYGHGRIEFFAAGLQGAMILLAALGIFREAIPGLWDPPNLQRLNLGLLLSVVAGLANGGVGLLLIQRGRRMRSPTMAGEGQHLLTDTITTLGVIVGLLLVRVTGIAVIDPIAAIVVGLLIVRTGVNLLHEASDRLMDRADPVLLNEIVRILSVHRRDAWIEAHQLRAWTSGDRVHVDLHITLPRYWDLETTHDVQRQMFNMLRGELTRPIELMVHPDPCRPTQCEMCRVDACPVRAAAFTQGSGWDLDSLIGGPHGRTADPLPKW
ncbi:MAG: cation diffusion facilitator family transporter [Acidobacteriota bacterium]